MSDSSGQTKIKCNLCGEEFECGYAANMHRKECPPPIDWDNIEFTIFKHSVLNKIVEQLNDSSDGKVAE